jgi:hypothetical protein
MIKAKYTGSVDLSSICWASGLPQSRSIHTAAKLTMSFPKNVVTTNFLGANLQIPRSIIIISSGGNGVNAATNEPNEPYLASNNCNGVIRVNVFFLIRFLPR